MESHGKSSPPSSTNPINIFCHSKRFYEIHFNLHGVVPMTKAALAGYDLPLCRNCHGASGGPRCWGQYCTLKKHLKNWIPRDLSWCQHCKMFTSDITTKIEGHVYWVNCNGCVHALDGPALLTSLQDRGKTVIRILGTRRPTPVTSASGV